MWWCLRYVWMCGVLMYPYGQYVLSFLYCTCEANTCQHTLVCSRLGSSSSAPVCCSLPHAVAVSHVQSLAWGAQRRFSIPSLVLEINYPLETRPIVSSPLHAALIVLVASLSYASVLQVVSKRHPPCVSAHQLVAFYAARAPFCLDEFSVASSFWPWPMP